MSRPGAGAAPAPAPAHALRTLARGRPFRRLLAVRLTSQAADGAVQAGLAGLFFFSPERQATAVAVAAAFAVAILPYTLVGPFAGVLLDRVRRRQVLLAANLVRAALVPGIALLVLAGLVGPPLYLAVLVCLSVNRFFLAGLGASLPHVVRDAELVTADAVTPTAGTVAALAGAGVGYAVRLAAGPGDGSDALVLLLAAAAYLASALLTLRIPAGSLGPGGAATAARPATGGPPPGRRHAAAEVRGIARGMLEGARHVRSRRPVVLALAVLGAHRLGMGVVTVVTILLCRAHLADPADVDAGLALLGAAVALTGAGYGAAALVTPPLTRRLGLDRCIAAGTAVAAVAVLAVAAALTLAPGATLPVLLASGFVLGVASQTVKICIDAVLQRGVAEAYLGRVFSLHDIVFNGCFVAAAAVAALVLPPDGASPAVVAAAAALYGAVALALQVTPLGHVPGVGGYRAEA